MKIKKEYLIKIITEELEEVLNRVDEFLGFGKPDCWCVDEAGEKVGELSSEDKCRGDTRVKCKDPEDEKKYAIDAPVRNITRHIRKRQHAATTAANIRE